MPDPLTRIEADDTSRPAPRLSPLRALVALGASAAAIACLLPFDGAVLQFTARFQENGAWALGGDLRRELLFVQQWGDAVCSALVLAAVCLVDQDRRRQVWDAVGAIAATALAYQTLKVLIGRPRPRFNDPLRFFTSVEPYSMSIGGEAVTRYSWEVGRGVSSDLWSMPSSHTAAAMCLSVILTRWYPRLAPLVIPLAFVVGVCRVIFGAHYPTDVVAGLCIGYLAGSMAMDRAWGTRLAARLNLTRPGPETSAPTA